MSVQPVPIDLDLELRSTGMVPNIENALSLNKLLVFLILLISNNCLSLKDLQSAAYQDI